jgi:hypothetical protein
MGFKVVLGSVAAATVAMSIWASATWADDTGVASIHALRREGGRICMVDHWHFGSSGAQRSQGVAQRTAIRAWQEFTDFEYGSDWARFSRAAAKRVRCSRRSAGWYCDVEARPCR